MIFWLDLLYHLNLLQMRFDQVTIKIGAESNSQSHKAWIRFWQLYFNYIKHAVSPLLSVAFYVCLRWWVLDSKDLFLIRSVGLIHFSSSTSTTAFIYCNLVFGVTAFSWCTILVDVWCRLTSGCHQEPPLRLKFAVCARLIMTKLPLL